jgi:flagellar basal body P-ring formation protein FlgA
MTMVIFRCWLTSLLLCGALSASAKTLTITIRPQAFVEGPQITIGDVAEIHGDVPGTVAKVRQIVIGQSPPAGEERNMHGGYIITRLKQHGFYDDDVEVNGPEKIRITRAFQRIESRDVETAILRAIQQHMTWDPKQTTVHELRGVEAVLLPPGPVEYDVTFPLNSDFLGPTSFTVAFRVAGNVEARQYGTAYIDVTQDVVTTARPIARNDIIEAADVRLTRMNMARVSQQVYRRAEDVVGKRARRALQANTVIHTHEVENLPTVQKGDMVLMLAESALLKVSTMGEALESGMRGDTIRIKNITSNREVRAIIVDKKTVKVLF